MGPRESTKPTQGRKSSEHVRKEMYPSVLTLRKAGDLANGRFYASFSTCMLTFRPPHLSTALPSACESISILQRTAVPRGRLEVSFVLLFLLGLRGTPGKSGSGRGASD